MGGDGGREKNLFLKDESGLCKVSIQLLLPENKKKLRVNDTLTSCGQARHLVRR